MSLADAAWLAGFFDGEGSLTAYMGGKNRQYPAWVIDVPNTNVAALRRCVSITGVGSISTKGRNKPAHHKQQYQWGVHAQRDVASILTQMLPHLTIKADKARIFLSTWSDI
jgi:hypothetical protein